MAPSHLPATSQTIVNEKKKRRSLSMDCSSSKKRTKSITTPAANRTTRLHELSQQLPSRSVLDYENDHEKINKIASAVTTILECIGEDTTREGLLRTPTRVAKALLYCTKGGFVQMDQIKWYTAIFTFIQYKDIVKISRHS